eukprot:1189315-Prorocentrum_minimum.AAC.3
MVNHARMGKSPAPIYLRACRHPGPSPAPPTGKTRVQAITWLLLARGAATKAVMVAIVCEMCENG